MNDRPKDTPSLPDVSPGREAPADSGAATVQESDYRHSATWLIFQRATELLVRFFVGAWVVRYLGPEQFGIYSYALSFMALVTEVATLGLDKIVVRDLARAERQAGQILASAIALRVCSAGLAYILTACLVYWLEDENKVRHAINLLALQLLISPALVLDLWFQSEVRARALVIVRTTVTLLVAALQVACISAGLSVWAFLLLAVVQSTVTAAGYVIWYRRVGPRIQLHHVDVALMFSMLRGAIPMLVAGLSIAIYMRIDQVMLGRMAGLGAVGLYGAAVKISEVWYVLPTALAVSAFPAIVQMQDSPSSGEYHRQIQKFYDWMAAYSYVATILTVIGAPWIVRILFGSAYLDAVEVLRVHALSLVFVSLGVIYTRWLVAEDLAHFSMLTTLGGAVINVIGNLVLIPAYGAVGAAWATLAAYAFAGYLSALFFRPIRPAFAQLSKALAIPLRVRSIISAAPR